MHQQKQYQSFLNLHHQHNRYSKNSSTPSTKWNARLCTINNAQWLSRHDSHFQLNACFRSTHQSILSSIKHTVWLTSNIYIILVSTITHVLDLMVDAYFKKTYFKQQLSTNGHKADSIYTITEKTIFTYSICNLGAWVVSTVSSKLA